MKAAPCPAPPSAPAGGRARARPVLGALALLLGGAALAQVPPAVHMPPAPPAPPAPAVPGNAVTPAPAMTPSGRVTPGGVRNARRHAPAGDTTAAETGGPSMTGDGDAEVPEAGEAPMRPPAPPAPPSMWTAAQAREAFRDADVNGDGVLSRAEAQRLPVMPRSFEDLDANKDGVLDLGEYLAGFPR